MDAKDEARNNRLSLQSKKRVSDVLYHDARKACNDKVKVGGNPRTQLVPGGCRGCCLCLHNTLDASAHGLPYKRHAAG